MDEGRAPSSSSRATGTIGSRTPTARARPRRRARQCGEISRCTLSRACLVAERAFAGAAGRMESGRAYTQVRVYEGTVDAESKGVAAAQRAHRPPERRRRRGWLSARTPPASPRSMPSINIVAHGRCRLFCHRAGPSAPRRRRRRGRAVAPQGFAGFECPFRHSSVRRAVRLCRIFARSPQRPS